MLARWTVNFGPEFERSRDDCELPPDRLQLHIDGFKNGLEREPLTFGEAYPPDGCIVEARDYAHAVLITAYVKLFHNQLVAQIRWVAETPLPADDLGPLGPAP